MMDWLINIFRSLSFLLDSVVYSLIGKVYEVFSTIANTNIFTDSIIDVFSSKVYALLGIFMLFKVSFSIMTYIVNPDEFADKNKGFSKLISNVVITLALLIFSPWIFRQAMDIQRIVLKDNVIGKLFSTETTVSIINNPGDVMAYETFSSFYHLSDTSTEYGCVQPSVTKPANIENSNCQSYLRLAADKTSDYQNTLQRAYNSSSASILTRNHDLLNERAADDEYMMDYLPFVSTICGGFILWILVIFCFDVAVRSVKLGFLRMIAPVPIISRIDPKKGKETFDKWLKSCLSTYLDLFIRLLAISFAVFIISLVPKMSFTDAVTGQPIQANFFVKVFIIMGALLFAKQLPQLISDITGFKMDGKFTLNPLKKLEEVPLVGKPASTALQFGGRTALALGGFAGKQVVKPLKRGGKALATAIGGTAFGSSLMTLREIGGDAKRATGEKWDKFKSEHPYVNEVAGDVEDVTRYIGADARRTVDSMLGPLASNRKNKDNRRIEQLTEVTKTLGDIENRAIEKIKNLEAGDISKKYASWESRIHTLKNMSVEQQKLYKEEHKITMAFEEYVANEEVNFNEWLNNAAKYQYEDNVINKVAGFSDPTLLNRYEDYKAAAKNAGMEIKENGKDMHSQFGATKGDISNIKRTQMGLNSAPSKPGPKK